MSNELTLWSLFDIPMPVAATSFIGELKSWGLFDRGNMAFAVLTITLFLAAVLLTINAIQVRKRKEQERREQEELKNRPPRRFK